MTQIEKELKQIIKEDPASLKAYVAHEALECGYDLKSYFRDLTQYGCMSGMVSSLIYYRDTHQFFEIYYDQIDDLRQHYEESTGCKIDLGHDLKNTLAWFAFEETAYQLASELDII